MGGLVTKLTGFLGGFNIWTWLIVIGSVAAVSAGTATFVTANYYNKLIVTSSTTAATYAYDKAIAAQKKADGDMYQAGVDAGKLIGEREKQDDIRSQAVDDYLRTHKPKDIVVCRMPKETAAEINKVLQ